MILRIFVPNSFYNLKSIKSSLCYDIIGRIFCDDCEENASVYILDVQESNKQTTTNRHLIGEISKSTRNFDELPIDYITFGIDDTRSVLKLSAVKLPSFIPANRSLRTQIFLYDLEAFSELSSRNDENQTISDPISKLLCLIRNCDEDPSHTQNVSKLSNIFHSRIIPALITLSMFIQTRLSFLNSAFLNHFHFWVRNLEQIGRNK